MSIQSLVFVFKMEIFNSLYGYGLQIVWNILHTFFKEVKLYFPVQKFKEIFQVF